MRIRRPVLIGVGITLAVIGTLVAVSDGADLTWARGRVEAELRDRLGRDVSFDRLSLSLTPLAVRAGRVVVADDPTFTH